jgi:hypothetical protein
MTQPTDFTVKSIHAAHLRTVEATQALAVRVLMTVASALYVAATTVLVLMGVAYVLTAMSAGVSDWPGQYWFAVLPLVAAGATLHHGAARLTRSPVPPGL